MGSPGLFDGLCHIYVIFYIKKNNKKNTRKHYLNMAEKMLRNVSDLMLASVSHYEILEGERFGPKFASIRTAVCLFFFFVGGGGGGGACEHSTIDLLVCSGFIVKTVTDRY